MILALVWLPFVLLSASGAFALLAAGVPVPAQLEIVPEKRLPHLFLLTATLGPLLVLLYAVKHAADSLDRALLRAIVGPPPEPARIPVEPRWEPAAVAPPFAEGLYTLVQMIPEDRHADAVPALHAVVELMSEEEREAFFSMCAARMRADMRADKEEA